MGVFKWLRRERVTVTTRHVSPTPEPDVGNENTPPAGTIRTEEYKRDLAEFQARRSSGAKEQITPIKKKCGRHSLPVSCTDCSTDHDHTFNYEKKSAVKYKKKTQRQTRPTSEEKAPNIQFLFQNQVFMPGNVFTSYSEPSKYRQSRQRCRSPDFLQKQIDFSDDQVDSPPLFCKNNSLPFDVKNFLECSRSEEVDGQLGGGDKVSSCSSSPRNDSEEKLWEVMSELKNLEQWADDQLVQAPSTNISKCDDSNSDTSVYGLPIAGASDIDVTTDKERVWNHGKWGVVPVQVKKISGVTLHHILKKTNTEVNLLRKCRHPNIILLMGIFPDIQNNVHIICERCVDSLFNILHVQGRILSAQASVQYALDIANALVFLRMHGYIHTELTSNSIMITKTDTAKLADLEACVELKSKNKTNKHFDEYLPEPQYVNIEDTRTSSNLIECQPLISQHPSEVYLSSNAIGKDYEIYKNSSHYRWQAPELFQPDEIGLVYPCSKSDVFSLSVILWESCNAAVPWKSLSYDKLKEVYTIWKVGFRLPQDGTYPGSLLDLLQNGLKLPRDERINLTAMQNTLQKVKHNLDNMEYIVIPARMTKKKSNFSSVWDPTSPTDSDCQSPVHHNIEHKAVVHNRDSSTESERDCSRSDDNALYETIVKDNTTYEMPRRCYASDEYIDNTDDARPVLKYSHLPDNDYSSACSTPISKIRARITDIGTPGTLHRSDSTEYCSILSPDRRAGNFGLSYDSNKDQSVEKPLSKLSRSFTPKSYKPLHIKVPEFNLDSVKTLLKDQNGSEKSSYSFDIKNYSLPTTPIARSNKLRKNAWLSGDLGDTSKRTESIGKTPSRESNSAQIHSEPATSNKTPIEKVLAPVNNSKQYIIEEGSPESVDTCRDSFTGLRRIDPPSDFTSPETDDHTRDRTNSWSFKSSTDRSNYKFKPEEDVLANVNVKPLVAIHERWIYEANRKTERSLSLPENNRSNGIPAVKPASHCVDTLQKSLPQLNIKKPVHKYRSCPSPSSVKSGSHWEKFCQTRDSIAKSLNFARDADRFYTYKKEVTSKCTSTSEETLQSIPKTDRSTDTLGIEEFIRDLIRKEFQQLLHAHDDTSTTSTYKHEDIVNKGVSNIVESLKSADSDSESDQTVTKDSVKSFSRLKINGNNKPLLEITFSRNGENSLQVLDNCVNVTVCDVKEGVEDKLSLSMEDTLTEELPVNLLKRCQTFNAIQEARSTEDLYIDDDLSTQMQENFGGKVKLIPLHGSLHEILCEKEDDCCLIKVKQENGCDTIYFRCDNSDTESRDAIDGPRDAAHDTVVYKRSISVIEERIQRILPKDKLPTPRKKHKTRPKSEIILKTINKDTKFLSNSSPSLHTKDEEVEVNIENVMSYQDSSSEECLKCQLDNDDFELLERKIEADMAMSGKALSACGCLEKISEENLAGSSDDYLASY